MDGLCAFLIFVITFIPTLLLRAFVLVKGWVWFMVPLGLPVVSIAWMLGIVGVLQLANGPSVKKDDPIDPAVKYPHTRGMVKRVALSACISLLFWGVFTVYHSYM